MDYHPTYLFDSWAIPNTRDTFGRVDRFIAPEDRKLVEETISSYEKMPVDALPLQLHTGGDCHVVPWGA